MVSKVYHVLEEKGRWITTVDGESSPILFHRNPVDLHKKTLELIHETQRYAEIAFHHERGTRYLNPENMFRLKREEVGEVLNKIYDSEINVRINWMWDSGFEWYIIDDNLFPFPSQNIQEKKYFLAAYINLFTENRVIKKEWENCGTCYIIEEAVSELTHAIRHFYPNSEFVRWFESYYAHIIVLK